MSYRLQILVPESLEARIRKAALRTRVSKGEWVRRAIAKALEQGLATSDPLEDLAALGAPTGDVDQMLSEIEAGRR